MLQRPYSSLNCDHNDGSTSAMLYFKLLWFVTAHEYGLTSTVASKTSESKEKLTELSENTISILSLCMRSLPKRFNGKLKILVHPCDC